MTKEKRIEYLLTVIDKAEFFTVTLSDYTEADNMAFNIRKVLNPEAIFIRKRSVTILLDDEGEFLDEESECELVGAY